jgi:signal transduction histidine kinase
VRALSLRRSIAAALVTLGLVSAAVAGALILVSHYLHRAVDITGASTESVHLVEDAEKDLLLYARTADLAVRVRLEGEIYRKIRGAESHVSSHEEAVLLEDIRRQVRAYLDEEHRASGSPRASELGGAAYRSLERLVQLNLDQARGAQAQAVRWDELADILGVAAAVAVLILNGFLLWWLGTRAFRPLFQVATALDRYGRGHRDVAVPVRGPAELRFMAERFNEMVEALDRQRQAQMTFLAGVAHDLRTPLGALQLSTRLMRSDRPLPPEPKLREIAERVNRQITFLDRMLEDFLDMGRIEAGQLELKTGRHDLRPIVQEVIELFQASPEHRFEMDLPRAPVEMVCDPWRIQQVVTNLVSNAVKYSPGGGTIRVALHPGSGSVALTVIDDGMGVAAEDRQRIFEPFRRARASRDGIPGAGLGLHAARRIVEAHGGRIGVEAREGRRGSIFMVTLPLDRPLRAPVAVPSPGTARSSPPPGAHPPR